MLYPNATIICEEDEKDIPSRITSCIEPDEILKQTQRKRLFSGSKLRELANKRSSSM
jgi:hypothetical protein